MTLKARIAAIEAAMATTTNIVELYVFNCPPGVRPRALDDGDILPSTPLLNTEDFAQYRERLIAIAREDHDNVVVFNVTSDDPGAQARMRE